MDKIKKDVGTEKTKEEPYRYERYGRERQLHGEKEKIWKQEMVELLA